MLLSNVCLCVVYIGHNSRTESPRKTKIGTVVAHVWLEHHFQGQKVKDQGHQAALLSTALTHKAAAGVSVGKVLLCCVWSAAREVLGHQRGRRGVGAYCVTSHTACYHRVEHCIVAARDMCTTECPCSCFYSGGQDFIIVCFSMLIHKVLNRFVPNIWDWKILGQMKTIIFWASGKWAPCRL